ncbi:MAG: DUF3006 domain-containing protein [Clostridia bacterium]|nr:DUF3006 domain-containing protein [Clostridia bacterium]
MTRLEGFIDHFEQNYAIIARADRTLANVARKELPTDAREGDFIIEANESHHFQIDRQTTELRQRQLRYMADSFFD